MEGEDLGLSSLIKNDAAGNYVLLHDEYAPSLQMLYLEDQTIAHSEDIVGEGTTCYRARGLSSPAMGFCCEI
jgi:hypothetical protein